MIDSFLLLGSYIILKFLKKTISIDSFSPKLLILGFHGFKMELILFISFPLDQTLLLIEPYISFQPFNHMLIHPQIKNFALKLPICLPDPLTTCMCFDPTLT